MFDFNPFLVQNRDNHTRTSLVTSKQGRERLVEIALTREKLVPAMTALEIFCHACHHLPHFKSLQRLFNPVQELEWIHQYQEQLGKLELPLNTAATCHITNDGMVQVEACVDKGWRKVKQMSTFFKNEYKSDLEQRQDRDDKWAPMLVSVGVETLHEYCLRHRLDDPRHVDTMPNAQIVRTLQVLDVFDNLLSTFREHHTVRFYRHFKEVHRKQLASLDEKRTGLELKPFCETARAVLADDQSVRKEASKHIAVQFSRCMIITDGAKLLPKPDDDTNDLHRLVADLPKYCRKLLPDNEHGERLQGLIPELKKHGADAACGSLDALVILIETVFAVAEMAHHHDWRSVVL